MLKKPSTLVQRHFGQVLRDDVQQGQVEITSRGRTRAYLISAAERNRLAACGAVFGVPRVSDTRTTRKLWNRATEVFGSRRLARFWLESPKPQFGGKSLLQVAETARGRRHIEQRFGRHQHSICA